MPLKKTLIAVGTAALIASPIWAPGFAAAHPTGSGSAEARSGNGAQHKSHGQEQRSKHSRSGGVTHHGGSNGAGNTRRCKAHSVAYVVAGTLVSESLTAGADKLYSGELTVEVKRANHHAREAKGKVETYKVEGVRLTIGMRSASGAPASIEEVKAGDRVKVIGRITFLPKRCTQEGFTPTITVKHIIVHGAAS